MAWKANIAILVGGKGRGSNMAALAEACADPDFPARVSAVVAPSLEIPAAEKALSLGLAVKVLSHEDPDYASKLVETLHRVGTEYVCLAGYMRLLPNGVLADFPGRVLNIHPALLPKFGGKGMYGRRVHEAVLAAGEKESGCTVHLVTENYDEGKTLLQMKCPVLEGDTAETLASRVLELEHIAYPEALKHLILSYGR